MISNARDKIVELIKRIQSGAGDSEDFRALELATGNPNVWFFFDALELDDIPAEKLFDQLCLLPNPAELSRAEGVRS